MALTKVTSGGLTDDSIVNADVNSSAAIALSKLATDPSNATNLASGTVPTARLGSGTASSSTVLYGDQTYKAEPGGGKFLDWEQRLDTGETTHSTDSYTASTIYDSITPSAADSTILVMMNFRVIVYKNPSTGVAGRTAIFRDIGGGGYSQLYPIDANITAGYSSGGGDSTERYFYSLQTYTFMDSPATTSEVTYKIYARRDTSSGSNINTGGSSQQQSTLLIEVAAL